MGYRVMMGQTNKQTNKQTDKQRLQLYIYIDENLIILDQKDFKGNVKIYRAIFA